MTGSSDWKERTLGDIGETLIGLTYSPSQVGINGVLVLRSSNIQNGVLDLRDTVRVTAEVPERIRIKPSDILICVRNGSRSLIGKSLLLDQRVEGETFGAFMAVFRSPLNEYLSFFFQSNAFKRQVDEHLGATINQITNRSLKSFTVLIPPAEDRPRITTALADVSALIQRLESLIVKKQAIKQGMMQELLTGKSRLPGFDTPWRETTLSAVSRIKTGKRNNQDKNEGGQWPFYVRSATVERIDSYSYDCEAILVPGEGNIGSIFHYVNGKFEVHQRVYKRSDFTDEVVGKFIFYLMRQFFGKHAMENSVKATVDSLRLPTFKSFLFAVPASREEQNAIVEALDAVDAEILALRRRLASLRNIKQGMMQELLTGRTRLKNVEAAA